MDPADYALDASGIRSVDGRIGRGIAGEAYWISEEVTLESGHLRWRPSLSLSLKRVEAAPRLLDRFMALRKAGDDVIRRFAEAHGVLNLCDEHGLPVDHARRTPNSLRCPVAGQLLSDTDTQKAEGEPVDRWREIAGEFLAAVRIAASLHLNEPIDAERWSDLGLPFAPEHEKGRHAEWLALTGYANRWLEWTDVRPVVSWTQRGGAVWGNGVGDLGGALALQLAAAICLAVPPRHCRTCGDVLKVAINRPGRPRVYCDKATCGPKGRNLVAVRAARRESDPALKPGRSHTGSARRRTT